MRGPHGQAGLTMIIMSDSVPCFYGPFVPSWLVTRSLLIITGNLSTGRPNSRLLTMVSAARSHASRYNRLVTVAVSFGSLVSPVLLNLRGLLISAKPLTRLYRLMDTAPLSLAARSASQDGTNTSTCHPRAQRGTGQKQHRPLPLRMACTAPEELWVASSLCGQLRLLAGNFPFR